MKTGIPHSVPPSKPIHLKAVISVTKWLTVFLFPLFMSIDCNGQIKSLDSLDATDSGPGNKKAGVKFESGIEYLTPTHNNRSIQTVTANLFVGREFFEKIRFSVYGGVTTTYAWGTIVQWDDNFNNITYHNNAAGIGPAFQVRFEPFVYNRFSFSPDFGGGLIFYSSKFPHGGDIYNFMWRMGGAIHYRVNSTYGVNLTSKWLHVSNGQGLGAHNPSYEAWGVGVAFVKYL
ncbi:hypothetical protein [uncultured Imperialibacter sp.]|uniref:hypothetical protein n=1 Tax=uncultured Imperialibacter sp. TaxID=1672639 RepID=UPI0030DA0A8E|tara:strand:- start:7713 stop:8405 length:693 start_codon:yes stop_codon:yes gene_type:complete